jgi:Transposase, Mutator family
MRPKVSVTLALVSLVALSGAYVWLDALALKVREAGRIQSCAALVATGVNASGIDDPHHG